MIRDEMHSTLRSFGKPFLMGFVTETGRSFEVDKTCPRRIGMKFEVLQLVLIIPESSE